MKEELNIHLISQAIDMLIVKCQEKSFAEEKTCLEQQISLSKKSRLLQYSPMMDEKKILRAERRINRADVSESMKKPIILDRAVRYTTSCTTLS